jgi:hypothetical protein
MRVQLGGHVTKAHACNEQEGGLPSEKKECMSGVSRGKRGPLAHARGGG